MKNKRIHKFNKKCRVCGDKAVCFNFNGLSCETCKIFFRRNACRTNKLKCRREGKCEIDCFTRKCCAKCRLDKCFSIGMTLHSGGSDDSRSMSSKSEDSPMSDLSSVLDIDIKQKLSMCGENDAESEPNKDTQTTNPQSDFNLNAHEIKLIEEVRNAKDISFVDERTLPLVGEPYNLTHAMNMPAVYVSRIVRFCKNISAFCELKQQDQMIIVKQLYYELIAIRIANLYDEKNDGFPLIEDDTAQHAVFMKMTLLNESKNKDAVKRARLFSRTLQDDMENDPMIMYLLITQFMFKARETISCPENLQYQYSMYHLLLRRYLEHKYKSTEQAERKYHSLMKNLTDLYYVKEVILELLVTKVEPTQLSHIVAEMYNLT